MNNIQNGNIYPFFSNSIFYNQFYQIKSHENVSNLFTNMVQNLPQKSKSIVIESIIGLESFRKQNYQVNHSKIQLITAEYRQTAQNMIYFQYLKPKVNEIFKIRDNRQLSNEKYNYISHEVAVKLEPQLYSQIEQNHQDISKVFSKKIKNQTKNIPKNYGKAIITFIEKHRFLIRKITTFLGIDFDDFIADLKSRKKTVCTIADLRVLWSKYQYSKCMRVISSLFLRKYALFYIFSSRVLTFNNHIKYRQRLSEALTDPEEFNYMKYY